MAKQKAGDKPDAPIKPPTSGSALTTFTPTGVVAGMVGGVLPFMEQPELLDPVRDYAKKPYEKETPADKVKKLPKSGYDYVKYSYMDREFKEQFPFYSWEVLHKDFYAGWISYTVRVTDRVTGNNQIGAGAARITTFKDAEVIDHKAIVDLGHSDASALTNALKNAMSRFGVCADVYRRIEEDLTDEQKERWEELYKQLPLQWKVPVEEKWKGLGAGFSEFLDALELKIADFNRQQELRNRAKQQPPAPAQAPVQNAEVKTETQTTKPKQKIDL